MYSERGSSLEGSWVGGGGGALGEEDPSELTRRLRSALPEGDLNCYTVKRFFTWRLRFSAQDVERTFADTNSPIPVNTYPAYIDMSPESACKYSRLPPRSSPLGLDYA